MSEKRNQKYLHGLFCIDNEALKIYSNIWFTVVHLSIDKLELRLEDIFMLSFIYSKYYYFCSKKPNFIWSASHNACN